MDVRIRSVLCWMINIVNEGMDKGKKTYIDVDEFKSFVESMNSDTIS